MRCIFKNKTATDVNQNADTNEKRATLLAELKAFTFSALLIVPLCFYKAEVDYYFDPLFLLYTFTAFYSVLITAHAFYKYGPYAILFIGILTIPAYLTNIFTQNLLAERLSPITPQGYCFYLLLLIAMNIFTLILMRYEVLFEETSD